jgi:hypothetical protein
VPILERDGVALLAGVHRSTDCDNGATEPAICGLYDQVGFRRDLGHPPASAVGLAEDVGVVVHDRRLYGEVGLPPWRHASLTSGFVLSVRSGPLAAWAAAFFAGRVSVDQAADAVIGRDAPHQVGGLPAFDYELMPLREVLIAWRRSGGSVRAVLPVAGDVRGLPGPAAFRSAALEHGEAVVGPGIAVVPEAIDYSPSSAPPTVLWQAFECAKAPVDYVSVVDAQYDLTTAIRDSASALSAADVAGWMDDIADELHDARRASEHLNLPPHFPPRAVALLAQAERLQAVLNLAFTDPTGGAIDRTGIAARSAALQPLATAVRRARVAGYNAEARD